MLLLGKQTYSILQVSARLICLLFCVSCANIAPPSGGEKDTKIPTVVKTYPKQGDINVKSNTIRFVFSEQIDENKLKDQLLITPYVKDYTYKINKNILEITINPADFKDSTTYFITLRGGIKDLTEGNIATDAQLSFSTGSVIDSLHLSGIVRDLLSYVPVKNAIVSLYAVTDTFDLEKQPPVYLTRSNEVGTYEFANIKKGTYLLYSFHDENNNQKYTKPKEAVGYKQEPVVLEYNVVENLFLAKEDHSIPRLRSLKPTKSGEWVAEYNKPLDTLLILPMGMKGNTLLTTPLKEERYKITTKSQMTDSSKYIVKAVDMFNNYKIDTVTILATKLDTNQLKVTTDLHNNDFVGDEFDLKLQFNKPVFMDSTESKMYLDKTATPLNGGVWNSFHTVLQYTIQHTAKDSLQILFPEGTFRSQEGYRSKSVNIKLMVKELEKFGSIGGSVQTDKSGYILQLVDKNGTVVRSKKNAIKYLFNYLPEGEYTLRALIDSNNDGKWNQGNYSTRQNPEMIYMLDNVIKLKSNWEILDVNFSF